MAKRAGKRGKRAWSERAFYAGISLALVLFALVSAVTLLGVLGESEATARNGPEPAGNTRPPSPGAAAYDKAPGTPASMGRSQRPERPKRGRGSLIFVIDDVGWNLVEFEPFLKFPGPLTFAVLPETPYMAKVAKMTREAGMELILHQPLEAVGDSDPGEGAVYRAMSDEQIAALLDKNIRMLPGIRGINHHMGSLASGDERVMRAVIQVAKRYDIYYLDSLTIGDTAVPSAARAERIRYWERDVFLDNNQDRESIVKQINEGLKIAEKRGYAVLIGHVWSAELAQTLIDLYPQLVEQGYSLSTISRIMMEEADADSGD